jgi:hypothetical protein
VLFSSSVVPSGPRRNRLGKQSSGLAAQREIEKFYGSYKMFDLAKKLIRENADERESQRNSK